MAGPTSIVLGASRLGERAGADELADALISSPLGDVDTSNNYSGGRSESLLGEAIRRAGGLPARNAVYSKADSDPETGRFDGDRVRRSIDETFARLGIDFLPFFHLHDPFTITLQEAMSPGGAVPALVDLREQGLVGAIGIATGPLTQVREYVSTGVFDAVLCHNRYTLVDRSAESVFEDARIRGMTVLNAAPYGGGTLANSAPTYGYRPMPADFAAHLERVRAIAIELDVDLAAAALHFSLRSPLVDATIVGVPSIARLRDLEQLARVVIPDAFYAAVEDLGEAPVSGND